VENYVTAGQTTDDWQYGAVALHARYIRLQTHSKDLILIAVPQQQWLLERASVLRYTFSACLVPPQMRHRNVCSLLTKRVRVVSCAIASQPFPPRVRV
jgi:hypothetical protein